MTLSEQYMKESPETHDSWMKMNINVLKLVRKLGNKAIIWKNMSTKNCKWWERFAIENDFFEEACIYRDGISKCFDY